MIGEEILEVLDRLIAQAEDKRVQQFLHIAGLRADGDVVVEAEDVLRKIEGLLESLRQHRLIQHSALHRA